MGEFAETVFGTEFDETSLVVEDRLTVDDWTAAPWPDAGWVAAPGPRVPLLDEVTTALRPARSHAEQVAVGWSWASTSATCRWSRSPRCPGPPRPTCNYRTSRQNLASAIGVIDDQPVLDLDGEQDTVAGYHSTVTVPVPVTAASPALLGRERSLFYVACSRARDELVVTWSGTPPSSSPPRGRVAGGPARDVVQRVAGAQDAVPVAWWGLGGFLDAARRAELFDWAGTVRARYLLPEQDENIAERGLAFERALTSSFEV